MNRLNSTQSYCGHGNLINHCAICAVHTQATDAILRDYEVRYACRHGSHNYCWFCDEEKIAKDLTNIRNKLKTEDVFLIPEGSTPMIDREIRRLCDEEKDRMVRDMARRDFAKDPGRTPDGLRAKCKICGVLFPMADSYIDPNKVIFCKACWCKE